MKQIERNTDGLRDFLFDELEKFRAGKLSPKNAQVSLNFVREIINVSRLGIVNEALLAYKNRKAKKLTKS